MNQLTPYLIYIKIASIALLLGGVFAYGHHRGYQGEHDKFVTFQAQVEAVGKAQAAEVVKTDLKNKEAANVATQNLAGAVSGITDYYKRNPVVRVQHADTCGGRTTQAADNPSVADDSATSSDAPAYVSEYNPEEVELVAARLDGLQKLLIKDGVTVQP